MVPREMRDRPHRLVHAHPDDEALLTAGTMARASAEGNRVVLLVATDGAAGLTSASFREGLAETRRAEVEESALHLGVARVVHLGYADSGLDGSSPDGFAAAPLLPGRPLPRHH